MATKKKNDEAVEVVDQQVYEGTVTAESVVTQAPDAEAKQPAVYVAARKFRDIVTGYVYEKGEVYKGEDPARIEALSTTANKSEKVLIELQ